MKVQVLQEELSKALSLCNRFSSNRVQLPVLANILFETKNNKLRIASTNLEVSVSITIGAKIEKEGSVTVPARIISELVNNLRSGQVDLSADKEILEVKNSDFESKISGMNASDFPVTPADIGAESIKLSMDDFKNVLSKVLFSVSVDETRPVLTGVLLIIREKELVVVATDGFRLSQKKMKIIGYPEERRVIVPKNTLSEFGRLTGDKEFEFSVKKAEKQLILGVSNIVMSSRIIEGEFPDFERIIPKETKFKLVVDKEEFLRSIKLSAVFAKDSANITKITVNNDNIELTSESSQYGQEKARVDIKVVGEVPSNFTIAFNYKFLEEFLNVTESDEVQIEMSDPNSPVLLLDPKDSNYLHVIMPIRLQS